MDACCGQAFFIQILNEYNYLEKVNDTEACYNKLKVLNVGQLRDYQAGIFSYQCWNCISPEVFHGFYRENKSLHSYSTRNADNLVTEYRSGTRAGFSVRYIGPKVWNSLPVSIRAEEHLGLFKRKMKNFLLSLGS